MSAYATARERPALQPAQACEPAEIVARLVVAYAPERIVFGSRARGDARGRGEGDVDLLTIVTASDEPRYRCARAACHGASRHVTRPGVPT